MNESRHQFNHEYDGESVCINVCASAIDDVMAAFERYLKACGYEFNGHVTICEDDICIRKIPAEEINAMLDEASARIKQQVAADITADLEPSEDGKEGV